jgi:hypothetical protein
MLKNAPSFFALLVAAGIGGWLRPFCWKKLKRLPN